LAREAEFKNAIKRDVETRVHEGVKAILEEGMTEHLKASCREFTLPILNGR
jgi:hypothetical protein